MIDPNNATEIPATIMVLEPVPSHTMKSGAKADLGRLFNIMRQGSNISDNRLKYHNIAAPRMLIPNTKEKLIRVSTSVTSI